MRPIISLEALTKCWNEVFRIHDEDISNLKEIYNAGNYCRSKEKREAPYEMDETYQKCNRTFSEWLKQLLEDKKKMTSISIKVAKKEGKDQYLTMEKAKTNLVYPEESPEVLQTRRTSLSYRRKQF